MFAKPGTANYKLANERLAKFADVAVLNPAAALISPTNVEKGTQLATILKDASIKFVLGEIDEKGFAAAVTEWKKAGGEKVAQELAGLYKP
jgi:putative aldouronate transport system substrate-binding protein